jgi:hypothetical protein
VPVAILALYFLKLRRRPVSVPSTMLWRRSLEDLHVNSLFQRLRRNLLLFLQLLAAGLALLALAGPRWTNVGAPGQRVIFLIDRSASMRSTDVAPTRLDQAKKLAGEAIDAMASGDRAMIIAFDQSAQVVSTYTNNRALLRQRLGSITASESSTSLRDALEVASGLANPSSDVNARNLPQGVIATEAMEPARLLIYTDGGFGDVEGFSVGNLVPEVVVIGPTPPARDDAAKDDAATATLNAPSDNRAILALAVGRNAEKPDQVQVFGRARNYRDERSPAEIKLFAREFARPGSTARLIDAVALDLGPREERSFQFDLADPGVEMALEARLDGTDDLAVDDAGYAVLSRPRSARVLLVTAGNRYLTDTLSTPAAGEIASVEVTTPEGLKETDTARAVRAGQYDLVIFDRVRPEGPPEANALYFGAMPPATAFDSTRAVEYPVVLDWDLSHPLLQYVRDLGLIRIAKAEVAELPAGASPLIESDKGPLAFLMPRGPFVDAVVGFAILDGATFNTDWPLKVSFPLFLFNALQTLGRTGAGGEAAPTRPGQPIAIRADAAASRVDVLRPDGRSVSVERSALGQFDMTGIDRVGIYTATWGTPEKAEAVAVNLFDPRESDLSTRGLPPEGATPAEAEAYRIKIGYTAVSGARTPTRTERPWWPTLTIALVLVLLVEWFVYNRRVHL